VSRLRDALAERGATVDLVAPSAGQLRTADPDSTARPVATALATAASVLYDAVVVAGGEDGVAALSTDGRAAHFVAEAYRHAKPIGALGAGVELLRRAQLPGAGGAPAAEGASAGVVLQTEGGPATDDFVARFVEALAGHRYFGRPLSTVVA
jgi:catalase